jgi:hypothetical protein
MIKMESEAMLVSISAVALDYKSMIPPTVENHDWIAQVKPSLAGHTAGLLWA